jgi:hypothetical protein
VRPEVLALDQDTGMGKEGGQLAATAHSAWFGKIRMLLYLTISLLVIPESKTDTILALL